MRIKLYKSGGLYYYDDSEGDITSNGSYSWTIPTSLSAGSDYKVRVEYSNDPTVYDMSDNDFSLTHSDNPIIVTSPNGGEYWEVGHTKEITWISNNPPPNTNVRIILYKSGGLYSDTNTNRRDRDPNFTLEMRTSLR